MTPDYAPLLHFGEARSYIVVDKIGDFGPDPGTAWDVAGTTNGTKEYTLVRKSSVISGNADWVASAGTDADNSEWIVEDRPTADYTPSTLGSHTMVETPSGLSEGFEGSFPPYGWTMISMNDNNSISQSASSAYEGAYSARFSSYYSASSSLSLIHI